MNNFNRTTFVVMGVLLIVMIASAITFRMHDKPCPDQGKRADSLAKSVEDFPDHSRIPESNPKSKQ